jgi:opacity protein-like surface antigen
MRRIAFLLLAGASALGLASIASAADLPRKAPPPPLPPPCAQFGGFYVGGNVGWGYGEHKFRDLDGFVAEARLGEPLPLELSLALGTKCVNPSCHPQHSSAPSSCTACCQAGTSRSWTHAPSFVR